MRNWRAIIVGAGGMGKGWGRNLKEHPDVEVAGWVDLRPGAAAAAVDGLELRNVCATDDLGKALAEVRPDFLVDVTVPEAHCDVTLQALAAGIPVLGEKPMADSMERAREMVRASERTGKLYMVSQSRRYNAGLRAYKNLIESHVGDPGILNSDFYIGAHFGGFRDEMASPLVLDMAIHTFDAARYLSDTDPVSVYCDEFNPGWSWYKGDACATAIFTMAGGLRYTYRGAWCAEGEPTSWEGDWRAVGPHGTATWDGTNIPTAAIVEQSSGFHSETRAEIANMDLADHGGIAGSLRDFLNALETGATPMCECHDNIKSLAMVFASIESAATGKTVEIVI